MIHAVLPIFLLLNLSAGAFTIGAIEGVAAATIAITRLFSGSLSDILGMQKGLAVIGYGISTLMRPILVIAVSPLWAMGTQFGDKFGEGISVAPRKALMADITSAEMRSEAYRLRQSLLIAGACIGSIIAGLILFFTKDDFRQVFSSAMIPSCMALALLIIAVKPVQHPKQIRLIPSQITSLVAGGDGFIDRSQTSLSSPDASYSPISWQDLPRLGRRFWLLLTVAIFFNLGNSSDAFLAIKSLEVGISPEFVPVGLVVMNLVFAIAAYPISAAADRSSKTRILLAGFMLHAIIYFGLSVAYNSLQIWCLFALYGLHLAMTKGLLIDLIGRAVEPVRRGTALSLFNLMIGITLLLANLIAGFCWQFISSGFTFAIGAFFACLAALILLLGTEQ